MFYLLFRLNNDTLQYMDNFQILLPDSVLIQDMILAIGFKIFLNNNIQVPKGEITFQNCPIWPNSINKLLICYISMETFIYKNS